MARRQPVRRRQRPFCDTCQRLEVNCVCPVSAEPPPETRHETWQEQARRIPGVQVSQDYAGRDVIVVEAESDGMVGTRVLASLQTLLPQIPAGVRVEVRSTQTYPREPVTAPLTAGISSWATASWMAPTFSQVATCSYMPTSHVEQWHNASAPLMPSGRMVERGPTGSTWDYEPHLSQWRRRGDGYVVTEVELAHSRARHIIEYERLHLVSRSSIQRSDGTWERRYEEIPAQLRYDRYAAIGPCDICERTECECVWTTRDGRTVRVREMADAHLYNVLNMRSRRGGLSAELRYRPLVREAQRRGWYGGVPPLALHDKAADAQTAQEEQTVEVPTYRKGQRQIKL